MTRLFLAAGVAALAIASAAAAKPGEGGGGPHGGGGPPQAEQRGGGGGPHGGGGGGGPHGGGGGGGPAVFMGGGGGHGHGGGGGPAVVMGGGGGRGHGGGGGFAPAFSGEGRGHGGGGFAVRSFGGGGGHGGGGFAAPMMRGGGRGHGGGQAMRFAGGGRGHGGGAIQRQEDRSFARQQARGFERQQMRGFARQQARVAERQQSPLAQQRGFERQQAQNRFAGAQAFAGSGAQRVQQQAMAEQFNGNFNGRAGNAAGRQIVQQTWNGSNFAALSGDTLGIRPVTQVEQFVGAPVATVAGIAALNPLPPSIQYLYPDTPDFYYRYGDGYLYEVDRSDNLISALVPLLAGGFLPGEYLPAAYMSSYVPVDYGFNAFYPDYGDECYRYGYGVVYEVDCFSGFVEDVIPLYAGGYGVGQLLPSAYTYYNVPTQYRSLYYDTPDTGYWYAPGAIYQYEPRSSMITSVAALLSPGFTIGQPLPMGYDVYNVPFAYRATYYDTPTALYRYSNGYIYQVDPATMLVTAIVASLLT